MTRILFKTLITLLLLEAAVTPLSLRAQQTLDAPIVINPNPSPPRVSIRASREKTQRARYGEEEAAAPADDTFAPIPPAPLKLQRWMRPALGFWLSMEQAAITNAQMNVTSDEVLVGHSSEFGFGAGAQLDVQIPGAVGAQGLRLRSGLHRVKVTPDASVNATYSGNELETTLTVLSLGAMYRYAPDFDTDLGVFWFGTGPEFYNVLKSDAGSQNVTRLHQSWGLNWAVAVGLDMSISDVNDMGFEVDWLPGAGFTGYLSFRRFL